MNSHEEVRIRYNATENQLGAAVDNTLMLLQDKYGFAHVTFDFIAGEGEAEFLELLEASIEPIVAEGLWL